VGGRLSRSAPDLPFRFALVEQSMEAATAKEKGRNLMIPTSQANLVKYA
jgi:hypothetical protein